ncbi:Exostosin-like [Macleaya cordata]|uniref:Exostosin-like n=1 Tax=Macleaya cordata TaxID=56857 RepID=A0A200PNQ7_MACCD|nr:Exostosin-like [Macleaya cordata]
MAAFKSFSLIFSALLLLLLSPFYFLASFNQHHHYYITNSFYPLDEHHHQIHLNLQNPQLFSHPLISSIHDSNSSSNGFLSISSKISNTTSINGFTIINSSNSATTDDGFIRDKTQKKKKNSLEKIEEGLARARARIREAIRTRTRILNSTSRKDKEDFMFISRGSIYRNPNAFYQSHIEMERRFKVWTYSEGELPLVHEGPVNNIYSTEGQFIDEMESEKSPFLAQHPDQAHVFFLPISVARVRRFVFKPEPFLPRNRLNRFVTDYIKVISSKYPYWNRSGGADHFMVSCHDWGPNISDGNPELFKNFIRVLCNANTSEGFRLERDVSLPEVNLPFGRLTLPQPNVPPSKRSILAFFAGRVHGKIRKILLKHWKEKDNEIRVYENLPEGLNYAKLMGLSKFCLCPSGWEVASPRVVESIFAGCVPVLISNSYVLPFSDVLDWNQFSIQIPVQKIPEIKVILKSISNSEYLKMQMRLKQVRRHFTLNRPAKRFDLFQMVLHSVWLRRLNIGLIS